MTIVVMARNESGKPLGPESETRPLNKRARWILHKCGFYTLALLVMRVFHECNFCVKRRHP